MTLAAVDTRPFVMIETDEETSRIPGGVYVVGRDPSRAAAMVLTPRERGPERFIVASSVVQGLKTNPNVALTDEKGDLWR